MSDPRSLRTLLEAQRKEIAEAHSRGADGFATCGALTSLVDAIIRTSCEALPPGMLDHIAIIALGGYGRAELCPHSDTDIMILCADGKHTEEAQEAARLLLHALWDLGMNIGHSVRTVDDALAQYGDAFDSWTSMIEGRLVCGNTDLWQSLRDALQKKSYSGTPTWFIEHVFDDVRSRHERYGSSVKLLEPNIKKSAGGLRDIQSVFWLFRGTDQRFFAEAMPARPALVDFLETLGANGLVDEETIAAVRKAVGFLLRTRHEMHYRRDGQHDTLEYTLQIQVAEGLKINDETGMRGVEIFMRDYYIHARALHRLLEQTERRFREVIDKPQQERRRGSPLGVHFILHDDVLGADPTLQSFNSPEPIFEAFALAAENDVDIDSRLQGLLEKNAVVLRPDHAPSPVLGGYFRRILNSHRVAQTLHVMNNANILPRYIPEFGELVAFFQHNVYHFYTADEHTLIAIGNAEALREKPSILREVFRNLRRKDTLYAAILLHDIAKPKGVANHEVTGVPIATTVLQRLGLDELVPDVTFLVRNHLVMEQTAFRRNVHDPSTLREFAARFPKPELLDYLFVLTYADLSALNANVWTEWKAAMLQELYQRTAEVLHRKLSGDQIDVFHQEQHDAAAESLIEALSATIPADRVRAHVAGFESPSYLSLFSEEEISQHISRSATLDTVSTLFTHIEGYTEITIIARDAPFALSRFCAVLSANDANIFDANVFTRKDGVIIDRFRVSDAATRHQLEGRTCEKIAKELLSVLQGSLDIDHLFQEHHKKWKRRPKMPLNPTTRIDVVFEDSAQSTIIDVYAPDSVGFLYRITEAMSTIGLDIVFAKIATRVDGIVDAFYVVERTGGPVKDPARREAVRAHLLQAVRATVDEGLGQSS
jgi:[protein-PII] uridylyltransferase